MNGTENAAMRYQKTAPQMASADVHANIPALGWYTDEVLFAQNWERPELAKRDRSIVTVSAIVACNFTAQLVSHSKRALSFGVTPVELAEIVAHLAFYAGWPCAMSAAGVIKNTFAEQGIDLSTIAMTANPLLPMDAKREAARRADFDAAAGQVAPAMAAFGNDVVFGDLWQRPELKPRDRSLSTIAALIASGQLDSLDEYVRRGVQDGLTRTEIGEVVTHLAFYAGWAKATRAATVIKGIFDTL